MRSLDDLTPQERVFLMRAVYRVSGAVEGDVVMTITLNELRDSAHANAVAHGFYDKPRELGTAIALIHSECSEALEAYRKGKGLDAIAEELADVVIRVGDLCGSLDIDLEAAVIRKMKYNKTRPYRHGGKKI